MKLDALNADARKAAWDYDSLQFARDCAQIAKMFQANEKSLRAERRITHMRQENAIGASIVETFMDGSACHRSGTEADLLVYVDQAALDVQNILFSSFSSRTGPLHCDKRLQCCHGLVVPFCGLVGLHPKVSLQTK